MTDNDKKIIDEIKAYNKRTGDWPHVSLLADLCGVSHSTMTLNIQNAMKKRDVKFELGDWINGQSRKIRYSD